MEKRDLYDEKRHLTGKTIYKGEDIPKDYYILVVLVFIQNSKGEFLIQKRSIEKDGKYGSTGGHPKTGENSIEGMITEISEEIGINVASDELKLCYTQKDDNRGLFYDMYYMKKDLNIQDLTLQKEEVDFVQWNTKEQIDLLYEQGVFKKSHYESFNILLNMINNGKI